MIAAIPRSAMRTGAGVAAALALATCGGEAPAASEQVAGEADGASTAAGSATPAVSAGDLDVTSVVAPEPVTGDRTALYLVVRNRGGVSDALLALGAPPPVRAGLHRTLSEGGVSTMRAVDSVPVPAGGEARLAPGGFHGMLEGLAGSVQAGDTMALTLRFRRAGDVEVRALVVPYAALDALHPHAGVASDTAARSGGGR
ncbi:MAG: copper chaperone PCu(A)C [Gemmatimonadetes bacterium]|nr:copper chaperone PCu(A)C [Gemmatimonadota bacterium]